MSWRQLCPELIEFSTLSTLLPYVPYLLYWLTLPLTRLIFFLLSHIFLARVPENSLKPFFFFRVVRLSAAITMWDVSHR